jgi:hypothetical protein
VMVLYLPGAHTALEPFGPFLSWAAVPHRACGNNPGAPRALLCGTGSGQQKQRNYRMARRTTIEAQWRTLALIEFLMDKPKLLDRIRGELNDRQEKALLRMFKRPVLREPQWKEGITDLEGLSGGQMASSSIPAAAAAIASVTGCT